MTQYRFGISPAFELLLRERLLLADGHALALGSRAMDLLIALVEQAGQVVSRRELIDRVWPDADVEENNLNVQIATLRRVLGHGVISTRPGRGYCFSLVPSASASAAGAADVPRLSTNLPATLPRLFGREQETAELAALLVSQRMVTLLGLGGVGKTVLAQHLARQQEGRFRHGVSFVELAALVDPRAIPGAIASTLQIRPGAAVGVAGLVHAMASLEMLVVLDSAEHLVEGVAQVVSALHDAAAGVTLLVTSQAPLKLSAERVSRLGPLSVPERSLPATEAVLHGAIALFVDRAQASDARFVLTDADAALAIELCRALDGLPLAIELAAWRAPSVGLRGLVDGLGDALHLLRTARTDVPDRQQTLEHALSWSHELLAPRDRIVLRRLATLRGSSDLALIQAITADPGDGPICRADVVDAVATLVERSLLATVAGPGSSVRYRLLRTPALFADERLTESGEHAGIQRRHAVAVSAHFEQAYQSRYSGQIRLNEWEERHLPDLDNGMAALAGLHKSRDSAIALALIPGLILATPREQVARHAELLAATLDLTTTSADSPGAAWALIEATYMVMTAEPASRRVVADRAVAAARQQASRFPDGRWLYRALCESAIIHLIDENTEAGRACLSEVRSLENLAWPAVFHKHRWLAEVWLADRTGDGPAMYHAALLEFSFRRAAGFSGFASGVTLVNSALAGGYPEEAVHHGLLAVAQLQGTRHVIALAEIQSVLTAALIECGRLREAGELSVANWPLLRHSWRRYEWADYQALLAALGGRLQDAAMLLGFADAAYARAHASRTFNELRAYRRTRRLMRAGLSATQVRHLVHRGRFLDEEEIPAIAFGTPPRGADASG